ncbi:MAG: hypothetical protein JEZ07_13190 [Phycisphaerae bacterium]|nr:hypothetical protein [Phycisphaerae bacterium]
MCIYVFLEDIDGTPYVHFDIEDSGIGIDKDKHPAIFEPFIQEDGSISRKYGGTGLGLSITRQLAALMGGHLAYTSELGKGSIFSLVIPIGVDVFEEQLLCQQ